MIWISWSIAAISVLAVIVIIIGCHKKNDAFCRTLNRTLDDMIAGKEVVFQVSRETMEDKLRLKLKRLYEILYDRSREAAGERQEMQSLISDISHQVKTPVANLRMYHDILESRDLTGGERETLVGQLGRQVEKLDFLMQALVKLSRLEAGVIGLKPERALLSDILARALGDVCLKAEQKGIALSVDCPEELSVWCDPKWTAESFFNVIDNGVKYTQAGGRLHVTARRQELFVMVSVNDNGPGISEEETARIFRRFYRGEKAGGEEGIGIGLFLAREIVSRQGGYIVVKSREGQGAEFQIFLFAEPLG